MREIKFRGKYGNNQWIYGSLVAKNRNNNGIQAQNSSVAILVDDGSVGQYTGVHDSNGKEIYEGDIVVNARGECYVVKFIEKYARFSFWKPDIVFASGLIDHGNFCVMGNIWENPEMLGGVNDERD